MENNIQHHAHQVLKEELREQASLYALGLLEADETGHWEQHMEHCTLCLEEVRASKELLASVLAAEAERVMAPPPARIKETLMRKIAGEAQPAAVQNILRAAEGRWLKTFARY